jgi:hypothetical protein
VARGEEASPDRERQYIDRVRVGAYAALGAMPVPLSEANFKVCGASTVPTVALIDGHGIVRLDHPGAIPYEALAARVEAVAGRGF